MCDNAIALPELAQKLAMNNVTVSLWDDIKSKKGVYETVLNNPRKNWHPERFIVVVGAGGSHDAFSKLSLGADAAIDLKKHFKSILNKDSKLGDEDLIEEELERLARVYRLDKDDFETILLAISKFYPQKLKQEISKRYSHKFYPSLTYEIIAHLMKHRFVDAVINFNFDELLDQAIEDELGKEEYKKIIADGDYDESIIMDHTGLKHPIYLKPHGTNSNPSSLRFTREDYFALPRGIASVIKKLLSGSCEPTSNDKIPVNLVVVGFNMQSFEFNMLCEENLPENSNIYFINRSQPGEYNPEGKQKPEGKNKGLQSVGKSFIKVDEEVNKLDAIFTALWTDITKCFREEYKPRGVARHNIISLLFKEHNLILGNHELEYLKDRTWVELTLSIAKYKGFACLNQLVNDRFGKYFMLYRQALDKYIEEKSNKNHKNLQEFETFFHKKPLGKDRSKYPKTIKEFCKEAELSSLVYGDKTFRLGGLREDPDKTVWSSLTVEKNVFEEYILRIYNILCNKVNTSTKERLQHSFVSAYKPTLEELFTNEDSEVSPKYDISYKGIFVKPVLIKTSLALNYYTRFYLKKNNWAALFVVAETGEWMLDKIRGFRKKKVILVIADDVKKKDLKDLYSKLPRHNLPEVKILNWWLHNQHMTIYLGGTEGNYRPLQAIYFERRHRSTHIHPVLLRDINDCKLILDTFAAYCQKAGNIKLCKAKHLPSEVKRKHIDSFFRKHFKDWKD